MVMWRFGPIEADTESVQDELGKLARAADLLPGVAGVRRGYAPLPGVGLPGLVGPAASFAAEAGAAAGSAARPYIPSGLKDSAQAYEYATRQYLTKDEEAGPPTEDVIGGPIEKPAASVVPTASKPTTDPVAPVAAQTSGGEERGSRVTAVRMPDGKIRFVTENLIGAEGGYDRGMEVGYDAGVAEYKAGPGKGIPEEAAALSRAATAQRMAEADRNPIDIIEAAPVHEAFDLDRRRRALEYAKEDQLRQAYEIDPRKRESAELLTEAKRAGLLGAQAEGAEAEARLIGAKAGQVEDPVAAARRTGEASAAESEATFNARQEAGLRFAQSPAGILQVQATIEQVLAADKKLAALAKADPNVMAEVRRRAEMAVAKAHATGVLPGIAQENVLARDPYTFQSMSGGR